jgi:hypothetical protein
MIYFIIGDDMREIMNFIFNNIFLILFLAFAYYVYVQYKDLKEKDGKIKEVFAKTLTKYLDDIMVPLRDKATAVKAQYEAEKEEEPEEEESVLKKKEVNKKDIVLNDLNRLLMILEHIDTINEKVVASNNINKYAINNDIDIEEFPDMEQFRLIETFSEEDMNSLENGIAIARREYNARAFRYNEKSTSFPNNYLIKLLRLPARYTVFDAPKSTAYEQNFEVFEEVEPEINTLASLNLTREEIEREEAEKQEEQTSDQPKEEVVIEHSDVVLKPTNIEEKKD